MMFGLRLMMGLGLVWRIKRAFVDCQNLNDKNKSLIITNNNCHWYDK